jgi:hypothetical protein
LSERKISYQFNVTGCAYMPRAAGRVDGHHQVAITEGEIQYFETGHFDPAFNGAG